MSKVPAVRAKRAKWLWIGLLGGVLLLMPTLWSRLAAPYRALSYYQLAPGPLAESPPHDPGSLTIVAYNIAHGRGLAVSNWDGGSREQRQQRLQHIAIQLRDIDADVVVLNEVDFSASWSYGRNQAQYLAEQSGYSYVLEQRNLDLRILGWTWKFGNAVLSRYPITDVQPIELPNYSWWETLAAGKKRACVATIQTPHVAFDLVPVHLSHRSEALRVRSIQAMQQHILEDQTLPVLPSILAGDFNSSPPGWPHSQRDNQQQNAIAKLEALNYWHRPMGNTLAAAGFTYRSDQPSRTIDWIYLPPTWAFQRYTVVHTQLSDHKPVVAAIRAPVVP